METKLTLRLDEDLIGVAKEEAARRGTSVSKMVAGYFRGIRVLDRTSSAPLPPVTSALLGSLRKTKAGESDYRKHLEEKYL
jgi:hypothetical protein